MNDDKMELNKILVCRFCLEICKGGFQIMESTIKNMVKSLLPTTDLSIVHEPVACNSCVHKFRECFNFKEDFLCKKDFTYNDNKDVNLNAPTMNVNDQVTLAAASSSGSIICCLCMAVADFKTTAFVKQEEKFLASVLQKYFPDVYTDIPENSPICTSCHETLQGHITFLDNCLSMEEEIREYCKCVGSNVIEQTELDSMLQFMSNRKLEDYACVDLNAVKLEEFGKMDNNRSTKVENELLLKLEDQGSDIIKSEDMEIKMEIEDSEDRFDLDGVDLLEVETEEADAAPYSCKLCVYTSEDKNRVKEHMRAHKTILQTPDYKCDKCTFNTKYKNSILKHFLCHKSESEVPLFHCTECKYYTKVKRNLIKHALIHKDLSEVEMYKCKVCSYETRRKHYLPRHMLTHEPDTKVAKYKCDLCEYRSKRRWNLKVHMLNHKCNPEVTMYNCETCEFQSPSKHTLSNHTLTHKSEAEVVMHKCEKCPFKTKHKSSLAHHMLTHKSAAEVTMYKCDVCAFQTKRKDSIISHVDSHKSISEVKTYKCAVCPFKTRHKQYMSRHMVTHKDRPEVAASARSKRGAKKV